MRILYWIIAAVASWGLSISTVWAEPPIRPGDRIAIIGNTFADQLRIHGYLETLLLQHTMAKPISIRNLGWGGDMLNARDRPTNFPAEDSTLAAHKTDVIIACFGMGESFSGQQGLGDFKRDLRALITSLAGKKYNGESEVRLILVSPIACEDLGEMTPNREKRNRELQSYARAMGEVAAAETIPMVDLFEASRYLMDESIGPSLTHNGIHLTSYGYWALSQTFFRQLVAGEEGMNPQPWRLVVDAKAKTGEARGVEISDLSVEEAGLAFRVRETSAPRLPPPTDAPLPPQLEFVRDRLVVENLDPGRYALTVDGIPVATSNEKAWAEGVAVDASPAHFAAEKLRAMVNDKNLQFTYSWKALNQVHIVGERRGSPSGTALPQEVIEFNKLAQERDEALGNMIQLKTRTWRLTRISH